MIAYLIYEKEEGEKNLGFIRLFQEAGKEAGISFFFVSKEEYQKRELPELVLNRTRDAKVSLWYEKRGVRVVHGSRLVSIGNDKWKTIQYIREYDRKRGVLHSDNLPVLREGRLPDTIFLPKFQKELFRKEVWEQGWHKGEDLILKSVDGHGGSEVFLLPCTEIWRNFPEMVTAFDFLSGKDCIVQERIKSDAKDLRIYVMGNRIYHAMLRTGTRDFRSNYSLGGTAESYELSESERRTVEAYLEAFSGLELELCGLDFIVAEDGSLVFNELEEMVGCRMLYEYTDKEIVRDFINSNTFDKTLDKIVDR